MEKTNVIWYQYDPKEEKIIGVKIANCDPKDLMTLAQVASMHIPAVTALRKDKTTMFEKVDLALPNLPVTLKVWNKIRE